jgi:ABC-type transport system involved in multi-copper enzyme maturation permease subunit
MTQPTPSTFSNLKRLVPSSVSQVGTITKYELVNYFRSRRFFVLLIIGLIISGLLTALVGYYRPESFLSSALNFYSSLWAGSITFVIILSGIFYRGDAISGEFQNKTGLLSRGQSAPPVFDLHWKMARALIASMIMLGVFAAITIGNGIYYFGLNIPYQLWESLLFSVLYLIAVLGFTFFFSSLFKGTSMSILVTAILFLFAFNLIQTLVKGLVKIEAWFLITYGAQIISNVLVDPYPTTMTQGFGRQAFTSYAATIPEGIAILLTYFLVTAVLGLLLFERKEFT